MTETTTIVVGVDGSEVSVGALRWALRHAKAHGAEVRAVLAWDAPTTFYMSPVRTEGDYEQLAEEALDSAVAEVAADAEGVTVHRELALGRPGPTLCHRAENADLLVVGAHGWGGGEGFHLGSASNYCVHHAPCPVLVHRPRRG